ncbi:hypothetical protein J3A65_002178 [Rhizobium sp. PvP014]|nr:hypothetical protein [Rhizobium sp. PvP014]MBP2528810.1 hypothetical protein [Rhizobium sp. PvP099]
MEADGVVMMQDGDDGGFGVRLAKALQTMALPPSE